MTQTVAPHTTASLTADAKLVYNSSPIAWVALADKYGVTTSSLDFARANPSDAYVHIGVQAFGTKSTAKEIQGKLYSTIKGMLRDGR